MRQVLSLYELFSDLTKDIRSVNYDAIRAFTFSKRAENFFQKLKMWAGGNSVYGLPYLHILREHIGELIVTWGSLANWGYGMFSCNAGQHLNKVIKIMEIGHTNFSPDRFETIVRNFRIKQFYYAKAIIPLENKKVCSSCHQVGHNKKNKACPMHPSQPMLVFEESGTEDNY